MKIAVVKSYSMNIELAYLSRVTCPLDQQTYLSTESARHIVTLTHPFAYLGTIPCMIPSPPRGQDRALTR